MARHSFRRLRLLVLASVLICALGAGASHAAAPEYRAFWVDAWHAGFLNQAEVDRLLGVVGDPNSKGTIRDANCNTIFLQVRKNADACYPSSMGEPYMSGLTPADFNALQAVIAAAHDTTGGKQRIDVHAWMVTFRTSGGEVYSEHSDTPTGSLTTLDNYWITRNEGGAEPSSKGFDPGHPLAEEYLTNVAMDLVTNFDIDGIHYDYIRFESNSEGFNPTSVARYNARYGLTGTPSSANEQFKQWRRDQITALVRKIYAKVQTTKPWVKQSGSFVTWNPAPADSSRASFINTRPYYDVYSDWDSWLQEGILDMGVPMTYYDLASGSTSYTQWMNFEKDRHGNRHMIIGPGIYMNSLSNSISELLLTRTQSDLGNYADGFCGYSYFAPFTYGGTSYGAWDDFAPLLVSQVTPTPAAIPDMPWKSSPTKGHISGTVLDCDGRWFDGATVTISGPESRTQRADGTGFYAFIDVAPGTYVVTASNVGKPTKQSQVVVTAGVMAVADFDLCPPSPVISNVRVENLAPYSADVRWDTNEPATSQVEYGTTTAYGNLTPLDSAQTQGHSVPLVGLGCSTTYHYRVRSVNSVGGQAVTSDYTFTTPADVTAPVITNVTLRSVAATEVYISWSTDDPATSQVQYGLTAAYGSNTVEDTNKVTNHGVLVTGLQSDTTYHFRVKSSNGSALISYSGDGTFTTAAIPTVIVDDNQATYTQTASSYLWSTSTAAGGWPTTSSSFRTVKNRLTSERASCTWTPSIPKAGPYDVYVWYVAGTDRTAGARYTINYATGSTGAITVSQKTNGSQWVKIGTALMFDAGTGGNLRLTNITGESNLATNVVADAVKFVYSSIDQAPSVPQNLQGTATSSTVALTWDPSTDETAVVGYKLYRDTQLLTTVYEPSFTDTGLGANSQHVYSVSAFDARSNTSEKSAALTITTLAPPLTQESIACDRATATWYATPPFTFSNGGFGTGTMNYYRIAWDNSPTHVWNEEEEVWATTSTVRDAVSTSEPWYFHVRGYNNDGQPCGAIDKGPYLFDGDAPSVGGVSAPKYLAVRGGGYDDLTATWSGSDAASGLSEYQYAIGTSAGASNVLGWRSAGSSTSAAYHYAGALGNSYTYYWSVKAKDQAGNWSGVASSAGSAYANAYNTLAEAMNNPDGTPVIVDQAKPVSASLAGCFYVQEPDRSRGLRIGSGAPGAPGSLVRVAGVLGTNLGERGLGSVESFLQGSGVNPQPLAVGISSIGGLGPDPFTTGIGTVGSYNLGLLVRTVGRVSSKGTGFFVLSDGSGATVKVYSGAAPADNGFVGVTGVAAVESGMRVIRTRSAEDVRSY